MRLGQAVGITGGLNRQCGLDGWQGIPDNQACPKRATNNGQQQGMSSHERASTTKVHSLRSTNVKWEEAHTLWLANCDNVHIVTHRFSAI
jgi:hypothetical protein